MIAMLASGGIMLVMALVLARLLAGPTLHDRLLAAHAFTLCACLLVASLAVGARRPDWADVGIALALGEFVVLAAACKFLRYRTFQPALAPVRPASGESVVA
jgi:multicomponent Na+:H+ antiporter subunit F